MGSGGTSECFCLILFIFLNHNLALLCSLFPGNNEGEALGGDRGKGPRPKAMAGLGHGCGRPVALAVVVDRGYGLEGGGRGRRGRARAGCSRRDVAVAAGN